MWSSGQKQKKIILTCLFMTLALTAAVLFTFSSYHTYTRNFNKKLNQLTGLMLEQNPEISANEIMEILNSQETPSENYFGQYGIDLNKDSVILVNHKAFLRYLAEAILLVTGGMGILLLTFHILEKRRMHRIARIANYLKCINDGDYLFDMNQSKEGEMSILETEVYKTTIMLKEAAENSRKEKERLKDSLSDISHQLKTPLTSLQINLENLEGLEKGETEDSNADEKQRIMQDSQRTKLNLLRNAKRDLSRTTQMVQQLLTLSKLDANVIEFRKETVNLGDVVAEAVENVEALAELKMIALRVETEEKNKNRNVTINCDKYWQIQAITNVLKNGVEHAESMVVVKYGDFGLYKQITIENDGAPICEADRKNMFQRFYSGENSGRDSVGIGLSLANAVVRQDGGYITVLSEEDGIPGVRFIIRYV